MLIFLIIVAIILGIAGLLSLSEATQGVGLIGLACLAGILARLRQAADHQEQLEKRLILMDQSIFEQRQPPHSQES